MVQPPAAARRDTPGKAGGAGRAAATTLVAALLFAVFVALGVWQLQRLAWKTDLIARVEARIHAAPVPAPGPAAWPAISRSADEYRRIAVHGVYLPGKDTYVQAVSEFGAGFWVLTPLRTDDGFIVLVNRGFLPPDHRGSATVAAPAGEQQVTGLLRITEPRGGFLRANQPAADRWRSRDVAAIAARRGLHDVAPYFVDAHPTGVPPATWPYAGLTVVRFPNSHLAYAFTWFAMALATVVGWVIALRHGRSGGR